MVLKLGSLFDGSGTCPLAARSVGITPVWASEVEPYPIAVTSTQFPKMKHLGSVTDINGAEVEPVDVITFGSPCQDLSVAGKRAGLKHEGNGDEETTRSGLFMEAIRIIKGMREKTNGQYPRFAIWENVPGAFSSNKGEDFRTVLHEFVKISEPQTPAMPVPKDGWAYADILMGNGWSIAYRVLDAQFWGVPQRRKRIYVVADFRGQCAGEVLFKRQGLRRDFKKSGEPWKGTPWNAENGINATDSDEPQLTPYLLKMRSGCDGGGRGYVILDNNSPHPVAIENHPNDSRVNIDDSGKCQTLTSRMGTGGGNVPLVMEPTYCLQGNGIGRSDTAGCVGKGWKEDIAYTLNTVDRPGVCYATQAYSFDSSSSNSMKSSNPHNGCRPVEISKTLDTSTPDPSKNQGGIAVVSCRTDVGFFNSLENQAPTLLARSYKDPHLVSKSDGIHYIVRRLTPTECARLQGFPDDWGHPEHKDDFNDEEYRFWLNVRNTHAAINGKTVKDYTKAQMLTWYNKLHTDSAEYKMWGNGMAFPCMLYVMEGIYDVLTVSRLTELLG